MYIFDFVSKIIRVQIVRISTKPALAMLQYSFFLQLVLTIAISSCFISPSLQTSVVVAPIFKDRSRRLYTTEVYLKTPLQRTKLHLDLGFGFTWVDCYRNYKSSSYRNIPCGTPLCNSVGFNLACSNCFNPPGPGCANDTCSLFPENSVTQQFTIDNALTDTLALPESSTRGRLVLFPNYVFSCSKASLLRGLARGVTGLAAFGRSNHSLPAQISTALSSPRCFALCITGQRSRAGVAIFGSRGPYVFSSGTDLSRLLVYTPLLLNPFVSTNVKYLHSSDEYFIGLTSVKVNGKAVPLNRTLLSINDKDGVGGTKLSTATPYTLLETSIYKAFVELFVRESSVLKLTVTAAVKPFKVCYLARDLKETRLGPGVPNVDLVMQNGNVFWRISGANSMVRIKRKNVDVWCLGFMDSGVNPTTSVVIGGHQMEDNILQFDLQSKRLGFSSSILAHGTTCADSKFVAKTV